MKLMASSFKSETQVAQSPEPGAHDQNARLFTNARLVLLNVSNLFSTANTQNMGVKKICRVGGVAECSNSNVAASKLAGLKS